MVTCTECGMLLDEDNYVGAVAGKIYCVQCFLAVEVPGF